MGSKMLSSSEALTALGSLSKQEQLQLVTMSDWVMILRSSFDFEHHDEPYFALTALYNASSHEFIHRVWGQTVSKHKVWTREELEESVIEIFQNTVVCPGCILEEDEEERSEKTTLESVVDIPFRRKRAAECSVSFPASDKGRKEPKRKRKLVIPCKSCLVLSSEEYGASVEEEEEENCGSGGSVKSPEIQQKKILTKNKRKRLKKKAEPKAFGAKHEEDMDLENDKDVSDDICITHDDVRSSKAGTSGGGLIVTKEPTPIYPCDQCSDTFPSKSALNLHVLKGKCEDNLVHKELEVTVTKVPDCDKLCHICGMEFADSGYTHFHLSTVHWKHCSLCTICQYKKSELVKGDNNYDILTAHMDRRHPVAGCECSDAMKKKDELFDANDPECEKICHLCGMEFSDSGETNFHISTVHWAKCQNCILCQFGSYEVPQGDRFNALVYHMETKHKATAAGLLARSIAAR